MSTSVFADDLLNRSNSSQLDDQCIEGATSHTYFDSESFDQRSNTIPTTVYVQPSHGRYAIEYAQILCRFAIECAQRKQELYC